MMTLQERLFRRNGVLVFVLIGWMGIAGGCDCTGNTSIKQFECDNAQECKNNETCQGGKCVETDTDGDGWSPRRGKGVEDCDDNDADVYPGRNEVCDNGKDDNCDGEVDEKDCRCDEGSTRECGEDKGSCKKGTQQCTAGKWGQCTGGITPVRETCNGVDDDCDGEVDEDFPTIGKVCEVGQGECKRQGTYKCAADRKAAECDAKEGTPEEEVCDKKDNDCDGQVDEIPKCQTYHLRRKMMSASTYKGKNVNYTHYGLLGQTTQVANTWKQANNGGYSLRSGFLLNSTTP